jgi:hypothetical protein
MLELPAAFLEDPGVVAGEQRRPVVLLVVEAHGQLVEGFARSLEDDELSVRSEQVESPLQCGSRNNPFRFARSNRRPGDGAD